MGGCARRWSSLLLIIFASIIKVNEFLVPDEEITDVHISILIPNYEQEKSRELGGSVGNGKLVLNVLGYIECECATVKAGHRTGGAETGLSNISKRKPLVRLRTCTWCWCSAGTGEGGRDITYWWMFEGRDHDVQGRQVAHNLPSSKGFPTTIPAASKWLLFRVSSFMALNMLNSPVFG